MTRPNAIPLQRNFLTGELIDTRSARQKREDTARQSEKQQHMFSLKDVPLGGKRAKAIVDISHLPSPPLQLIQEDPRSNEEKEQARRSEMEANTYRLFADDSLYDNAITETVEIKIADRNILPHQVVFSASYRAYCELVLAAHEAVTTRWVSAEDRQRFVNYLPLAILAALEVGLTSSEITCAVQIGTVGGTIEKANVPKSPLIVSAIGDEALIKHGKVECEITEHNKIVGLRAQLRRASVPLQLR